MSFRNTARRIFCALLAAFLLLPAVGCARIPKSTKEESATVLTIDEYAVPYEQLRYFVRNYMNEHGDPENWDADKTEEICVEIMEDALTSLRHEYAILSLAKKHGIHADDKAIEDIVTAKINEAMEEYGSTDAYVEGLALNYMTANVHRFLLTVSTVNEELYYAMLKDGTLPSDEETVKAAVYSDKFIRVKQILIANDPGEDTAANRAIAEEALALALNGEDFDTLVKEYGESLYMFNNTDGYYMCRGVWQHAFEDAAFALEIGEISDIVETEAGYSILLRCEKEGTYLDAHMTDLGNDLRDAMLSLAIEEYAAEMTLTTNETFASYTVLTME